MKNIKRHYLTIKEFSILTHTSIDTLKYYDRIGLLKPALIGQNKYRYYLPEQSLILTRILFDTRAKIPLKEIKDSLYNKNPDEVISHYESVYVNMSLSADELASMQGSINNMKFYYDLTKIHSECTLFPLYLPEWFMLRSPAIRLKTEYTSSESDIANQLFLRGFYNGRWPHYLLGAYIEPANISGSSITETAYFLKIDHPEEFSKKEITFVRKGVWICMLMKVKGKGLSQILQEYLTKLKTEHIEIEGGILVMDIINSLLTLNPSNYCTMIYALKKENVSHV